MNPITSISSIAYGYGQTVQTGAARTSAVRVAAIVESKTTVAAREPQGDPQRVLELMGSNAFLALRLS